MSVILKVLPKLVDLAPLKGIGFSTLVTQSDKVTKLYEIPFLDRMGIVFGFCVIGMYIISKIQNPKGDRTHGLEVDTKMFRTSNSFAVGALIICGILVAIYTLFW